jgi:hypothetical protein
MHDVGVMFASENIAGAAHVGRKLINLIETRIHDGSAKILIAKIADDEVVGFR